MAMVWWDVISSRSNDLSVHARIDSTSYVHLLWESSEEDDKNAHTAIFEVKCGNKAEGAITDSRERTADQRLRCCVWCLHHEQAMKAPSRVRQFFKTVLQQMCHFKIDVIAGDAQCRSMQVLQKVRSTKISTIPQLLSC